MGSTINQSNNLASIALVDKGHQKLSEIHAHIKNLIKSNGSKSDLTEIFFSLSFFYENHLINEEFFLKKTGYPNIESHSASHKEFIKEIERLKDIINKDAVSVLRELDEFITLWLYNHETNYSADLIRYLKGKDLLQS